MPTELYKVMQKTELGDIRIESNLTELAAKIIKSECVKAGLDVYIFDND